MTSSGITGVWSGLAGTRVANLRRADCTTGTIRVLDAIRYRVASVTCRTGCKRHARHTRTFVTIDKVRKVAVNIILLSFDLSHHSYYLTRSEFVGAPARTWKSERLENDEETGARVSRGNFIVPIWDVSHDIILWIHPGIVGTRVFRFVLQTTRWIVNL